jgi:hypothetical protein
MLHTYVQRFNVIRNILFFSRNILKLNEAWIRVTRLRRARLISKVERRQSYLLWYIGVMDHALPSSLLSTHTHRSTARRG